MQIGEHLVPIEAKPGLSKKIKSMNMFLDMHAQSSYGIRYLANTYLEECRKSTDRTYIDSFYCNKKR